MRYRKIPKNNDQLSALGYGCMRFPVGADGQVDKAKAISQIHYGIERGINYYDTAWPYHGGLSEPILGEALQGGRREQVKIATKLPTWLINTRQDMDDYLNKQLEKLKTDRIDYYLLHALNGASWQKLMQLGVVDFLEGALKDGRIINPGFSFHGLLDEFKEIIDGYPWVFCQIQYNYLDQQYQAGLEGLNYAAQKDIGVIIMEPLRGGNLGLAEPPPAIQEIWDQADTRRTPVDWALSWIWNHPGVSVILSGMNDDEHIKENIEIAGRSEINQFSEDESELVAQAAAKYKALMRVGCTGCGYCMPCPEGVMISPIFEVYNKMYLFGNKEEAQFMYAARVSSLLSGEPGYASLCIQCGECLEKCPQGIPIPDVLAEAAEELEEGMEPKLEIIQNMFKGSAT